MTIHITGDIHSDISRLKEYKKTKAKDIVIIAGDFGLIWNPKTTKAKLNELEALALQRDVEYLFIDGNLENFSLLENLPIEERYGGQVGKAHDHIYWLRRGEVYIIEGKVFFCFGGALSIDRHFRSPFISWWPQEEPSASDIANARINLEKIDYKPEYIITHAAPSIFLKKIRGLQYIDFHDKTQDYLDNIVGILTAQNPNYKKWYFGHYHIDRYSRNNRFYAIYEKFWTI